MFHHLVVTDEQAGTRLDALLAATFLEHSRVRLRQLINAAEVRVNGERAKAAYHVRAGDVIEVQLPATRAPGAEPEDIPLSVLYEDKYLAVIDKPHGMVVHPSKGHWSGTLTAAIAHRFGSLSQIGGVTRPGIVHRLDRDTSGVIVIARSDPVHAALSRQFAERTVEKEYFAICRGRLDRDRDLIEQPIAPHPNQREKMAIRSQHPASRPACTFFEVERRWGEFLSLRVFPKTGRTHQIRVHLAHIGCPVLCDPLYSGQRELTLGELLRGVADDRVVLARLALHSRRLTFEHPVELRRMTVEAPLPPELQSAIDQIAQSRK
jgi:23S rRNA pseudouridine1911/1915/1917 synthase